LLIWMQWLRLHKENPMSDQRQSDSDQTTSSGIQSGPGVVPVQPITTSSGGPTDLPPANPQANRSAQLADGVLDRDAGEDYNPNTNDTVEANRARFEAMNKQIARDHHQLEKEIAPVIERVAQEAKEAAALPEHQAMLPDQAAHSQVDPLATQAGLERGSAVPPHLLDGSGTPKPLDKVADITDPNGPAVPVQNNSVRKDS
jgi:hypothetical protein